MCLLFLILGRDDGFDRNINVEVFVFGGELNFFYIFYSSTYLEKAKERLF